MLVVLLLVLCSGIGWTTAAELAKRRAHGTQQLNGSGTAWSSTDNYAKCRAVELHSITLVRQQQQPPSSQLALPASPLPSLGRPGSNRSCHHRQAHYSCCTLNVLFPFLMGRQASKLLLPIVHIHPCMMPHPCVMPRGAMQLVMKHKPADSFCEQLDGCWPPCLC
jgi:hypothetical protein